MSGAGSPTIHSDGTGLKVTIVAGQWHEEITNGLLAGARRSLAESGAEVTEVRVPGSFELPVASKAALDAGADAVVALGVIIRGGTPHFEYVSDAATSGLTQVSLLTGKPVGFVYQPGGVVLSGSGEVMGTVMKAGRAHVDDIPLVAGSSGYTLAQIKAAGQNFLFRAIDIVIEGIINQGGGVPVDAIE